LRALAVMPLKRASSRHFCSILGDKPIDSNRADAVEVALAEPASATEAPVATPRI
jgi:hypothetical protein